MIRLYLKIALPFVVIFLALNMAARALGSTQPPNPALEGFTVGCEGKPQPCWYGIVPNMPLDEAQVKLEQIGYVLQPDHHPRFFNSPGFYYLPAASQTNCEVELYSLSKPDEEAHADGLHLLNCQKTYLGDLMAIFGKPDGHLFLTWESDHIWLGFQNRQMVARTTNRLYANVYRAQTTIDELWVFPGGDGQGNRYYQWHGFVRFWKFCALEPGYPICPSGI